MNLYKYVYKHYDRAFNQEKTFRAHWTRQYAAYLVDKNYSLALIRLRLIRDK